MCLAVESGMKGDKVQEWPAQVKRNVSCKWMMAEVTRKWWEVGLGHWTKNCWRRIPILKSGCLEFRFRAILRAVGGQSDCLRREKRGLQANK